MPFTPEQKRQLRAKEKEIKNVLPQFFDMLAGKDAIAGKNRYKSEIFDLVTLGKIFCGIEYKETQEEEDRRTSAKNKKKKKPVEPCAHSILGLTRSAHETIEDLLADFQQWLDLRDKSRKDLYFLAKEVLGKDLEPDVHQIVCDQFVSKDFDGVYNQGYSLKAVHDAIDRQVRTDSEGRSTKEMILLDSRGFFKSTIDGIDAIQWMLNCPDVRILLLTGEYKLGVAFLKEIKGYLYLAEGAELSGMHLLFPEYIIRGVDGTSKEPITLDVRRHTQTSPTIWVNSIDSNLSGWHCDIKKADDVVTDSNSNNEDVRENLKNKFDGTGPGKILDDWGFSDIIGTRYFPSDLYGTRLAAYNEHPDENALKFFCRGCWKVKPEYVEVPLRELTEDMVILTFPQKRGFKKLRQMLLNNETDFRCQQLNEPAGIDKDDGFRISFDENVLRAHMVMTGNAPKDGDIYVCWDWALTANKTSDYSAGVAGRIYFKDGVWGILVLEVIYGRWKPSELALQIVSFNRKWNPKKTLIEKSNGSELLSLEIFRIAAAFSTPLDVFWKPPSLQENAKRNRIKGLETLLADNRMFFIPGIWIDETFNQFTNYTGQKKNKGRKDDIPDSISFLSFFLPSSLGSNKDSEEMQTLVKAQKEQTARKKNYERLFGGPQQIQSIEPEAKPRRPGDIFGGNGLRSL